MAAPESRLLTDPGLAVEDVEEWQPEEGTGEHAERRVPQQPLQIAITWHDVIRLAYEVPFIRQTKHTQMSVSLEKLMCLVSVKYNYKSSKFGSMLKLFENLAWR